MTPTMMVPSRRPGLTLVELLVVMAVLSLLTAGIVPGLTAQVRRAKILGTQQEITTLRDALRLYAEDVDAFPPTEDLAATPPIGGLQALIDLNRVPAALRPRWRGPYIISTMDPAYRQDAWDTAYDYAVTSVAPPRARVTSAGPDRSLVTTADNIRHDVEAQDLRMAKIRRVQAELEVITRAAQAYAVANSGYPAAIDDLYGPPPPYLWDESYRTDAWGNNYVRVGAGPKGQFKSRGPDGVNGGGDDIFP